MTYKTEQEKFWAGNFGQQYIERNKGKNILAANISLFAEVIKNTDGITSIMEFGANIGNNLIALRNLLPTARLNAVEINEKAYDELSKLSFVTAYRGSVLEYDNSQMFDFVFTKGLLIHINPEKLQSVYKKLYSCSKRYVFIAEYYNPTPIKLQYRNNTDKLFKRDFAEELIKMYPDLKLKAYGFRYHNDPNFPLDDITWFLLEKNMPEAT